MDSSGMKLTRRQATRKDEKIALNIENIHRRYQQGNDVLEVLNGVNLKIMPGEMVGLVGQSGSGKSTLLHLAGLLEQPSAGVIFVHGVNCGTLSDSERTALRTADIGFIYQFHHLLPEFTALENVMIPQLIAGLNKTEAIKRSKSLLAMVGLSDRLNHRPARLSGGEQQRVAIVRSIANVPRLVLADEPTGNLDSKTSDDIMALLTELHQQGQTIVMVTHEENIADYAQKVITMKDGQIISEKTNS